MVKAWRARREKAVLVHHKPTFDVYPDREYHPRVRIALLGGRFMETVDLDGYSVREILPRLRTDKGRDWLVDRIIQAHYQLVVRLDEEERRKSGER